MREGYRVDVRFYEDSDVTSRVHWYLVPRDRAWLNLPSFVQDEAWWNPNGMRSSMLYGNVAAHGEQLVDRPWDHRDPPRPGERFTGHICGTPQQWLGGMSINNPADRGVYGCCVGANLTVGFKGLRALSAVTGGTGRYAAVGRKGLAARESHRPSAVYSFVGTKGLVAYNWWVSFKATKGLVATFREAPRGSYSFVATKGLVASESHVSKGVYSFAGTKGLVATGGFVPSITTFQCGTVAAAGTTQGTAANIINDTVRITGSNGVNGVILPSGCYRIILYNAGAQSCQVYPPVGESLGALAPNVAIPLPPSTGIMWWRLPTGNWQPFNSP